MTTDENVLHFVQECTVTDPVTGNLIDVAIYYDAQSGSMVGVDSSWPNATIRSPYNDTDLHLPDE